MIPGDRFVGIGNPDFGFDGGSSGSGSTRARHDDGSLTAAVVNGAAGLFGKVKDVVGSIKDGVQARIDASSTSDRYTGLAAAHSSAAFTAPAPSSSSSSYASDYSHGGGGRSGGGSSSIGGSGPFRRAVGAQDAAEVVTTDTLYEQRLVDEIVLPSGVRVRFLFLSSWRLTGF
jgi:hypothetical protein